MEISRREGKRLVKPGECTCSHEGSESSWPAVIEDRGTFARPGVARWCLGHALIETCPNPHCGTVVAFCHLTGCGEMKVINPSAGRIIHKIYTDPMF